MAVEFRSEIMIRLHRINALNGMRVIPAIVRD
jgi:hypothetical protein